MWYGVTRDESAARAAKRGFDVITNRSPAITRALPDAFRASFVAGPNRAGRDPKVGTSRFLVLADTDDEAVAIARRAYPKWNVSLETLFRKHNIGVAGGEKPADWDAVLDEGIGIAGTPDTVLRALREQLPGSGFNYLSLRFAISVMTIEKALRSAQLFVDHVMPALREIDTRSAAELLAIS